MKGVLSWLVLWACRVGTRDLCSALAALWLAQYKILFSLSTVYCYNSFVPIAQQAGQAAVLGHLSISVCL
jgi:hypothetical protein